VNIVISVNIVNLVDIVAKALKKEVIFICRDTEIKEVHFDTNHFNHIFWKDEIDLKERLIKMISESIKP